jgi:hypothetical protein
MVKVAPAVPMLMFAPVLLNGTPLKFTLPSPVDLVTEAPVLLLNELGLAQK